jgi:hypothetical protein
VVLLFCTYPSTQWGFWIGLGIVAYGGIIALYGTLAVRRLFKKANAAPV